MESLEDRTLLAGLQILQIVPNDGVPLQNNDVRHEAPTELTFLFSPGETIDPASLNGIQIVRSGFDGGVFGDANDVVITPGFAGVGDIPNEAIVRFAENLPDDNYQITIFGSGATPLLDGSGQAYNNGVNSILTFELDLGAQIVAVNPQPIVDDGSGMMVQNSDQIVVHFNNDELDTASVENNPQFFQLINTQGTLDHTDDTIQNPQTIVYDNVANTATLTFASDIADGTYRLRIGISDVPSNATVNVGAGIDDNSSFDTATELSGPQNTALGNGDLLVVDSSITAQNIALPPLPGGLDEPGHRQIPVEAHFGSSGTTPLIPAQITRVNYNFQDVIGVDPSGNTLFNLITEEEKQRAREIFEIYSSLLGIEFIETDFSGILVATGDMRAVSPTLPVGPGGVGGVAGGGKVVMDPADNTNSSYGGNWMRTALHEIGHAIGLGHSYDIPSIQGGGLPGEPVFPGDYDIVHLLRLYRTDSTDIDLYEFEVTETGVFTAEIFAERLATPSLLNSALTLYRQNPDGSREVIARNDDYFSNDSYLELELDAGIYYVGVTSTGNVDYDPNVSDTGSGGTTDGNYQLRLNFQSEPAPGEFLVDTTGTAFDGDADGKPGGVYEFWFDSSADTIFVDKSNAASMTQDGSLADPYSEIDVALAAVTGTTDIIRILGNGGADDDLSTPEDALPYLIGLDDSFQPLEDGETFIVPQDVTVMIDQGAVLKLQSAVIDVGSSSDLVDRGGATLQVLGTPDNRVVLTSFGNDAIGGDTDGPVADGANPGDWGGIVYREDSDYEEVGVFLNHVGQADISFGGGQVFVDSILDIYNPIHAIVARPTISFNTITFSADSAISADPNSFDDTIPGNLDSALKRIGPDIHGNVIFDNSLNGVFVRVETLFGKAIDKVEVPSRFNNTDIVYIITENLQIEGNPGGPTSTGGGPLRSREAGRLRIDPGVVVKLAGSRIEGEHGHSNFIAEGTEDHPIIFTSIFDDRFGRGGTFDTSNDAGTPTERNPQPGDWGGIVLNSVSRGSIDHSLITFAGGQVPIEGNFDNFNAIEVHQARFRMTNTRLEDNADGRSVSNRNGRGGNDSTTVFVRGAQPIIVDNLFIGNEGSVISVNANSMKSDFNRDPGRSTGPSEIIADPATGELIYTSNRGPLVRDNRFEGNGSNGMEVRGEELTIESVWDDADIVHIVRDEILSGNFHTYGGIRLESLIDTSLVVKLDGPNAGFTAGGFGLDIDDRMGGVVQVVGQPLYPVVLTSLADDTVGAGFRANGQPQNDTNGDGSASTPQPGDWRSIRLEEFSYDRNVEVVNEKEQPFLAGNDINRNPQDAQFLGELAPNLESGDENRRLGFEIHGFINSDDRADVDVYSFDADAGTQVWFDIDRTDPTLNTVIELLNPLGNVLARSSVPTPNLNSIQSFVVGSKPAPIVGPLDADPNDSNSGNDDYYTSNPHDAGFRVVLPGNEGLVTTYFIRVRSHGPSLNDLNGGQTTGSYELNIRLRETDEQSGSTIRFSDIRYATTGIDVLGLPAHSALVSEAGEAGDASDTFVLAQQLGNLLTSDRNTISVAGELGSPLDIDFYRFELDYDLVQAIGGVNAGGKTFATIFDIDYADGLSRPDTTISVFDENGNLILVSRSSDVADDQPRPTLGNDFGDEERGTAGKLDPFIGSQQLPTGVIPAGSSRTYYVAVTSDAQLPTALNALFQTNGTDTLIRLEPVNSIQRIAEDHIGFSGHTTGRVGFGPTSFVAPTTQLFDISNSMSLSTHVKPYTLSDVVLFVTTNGGSFLETFNPFTGAAASNVSVNATSLAGNNFLGDIAMRQDAELFGQTAGGNNAASGQFLQIDTGTGTGASIGDDGLGTNPNVGGDWDALTFYRRNNTTFEGIAANNQTADDDNNPAAGTPLIGFPRAIWRLDPNGVTRDENGGTAGQIPLGPLPSPNTDVTGLAFGSYFGNDLYAVDDSGNLWRTFFSPGNATQNASITSWTLVRSNVTGTGAGFESLTLGPQNLDENLDGNADLATTFFATDNVGRLWAFDTQGNLQNVFVGGVNFVNLGSGAESTTGLAFSPVDFSLWHPTMTRHDDPGHGINESPDLSRVQNTGALVSINGRGSNENEGGGSFYFGLEQWVNNPASANTYLTYQSGTGQLGLLNSDVQRDVTSNANIGDNYNAPGGVHGVLETDSFSLLGYSRTDLPTLYFNYFLETENAIGSFTQTTMFDSARVFVSADDGANWSLLTTNNSLLSTANNTAELPRFLSPVFDASTHPQQRVQEMFDDLNPNDNIGWRQARVDLGQFAGLPNLKLRFDFATAGVLDDPTLPPEAERFGSTSNRRQGQANAFEGFYIDDIIIGFAERGEIVTDTTTTPDFFTIPQNPSFAGSQQALEGPYQLEIRRGEEYGAVALDIFDHIILFQQFDTNDRLGRGVTLTAPSGSAIADGDVFTITDDVHTVEFEFDNNSSVTPGRVPVPFNPGSSDFIIANDMASAINTTNTVLPGLVPDFDVRASSVFTSNLVELSDAVDTGTGAPSLNLTVNITGPTEISENGGSTTVTVTREDDDGDISNNPALPFTFTAIDPSTGGLSDEVTFSGGPFVIPAGVAGAVFTITGVDDTPLADGTQSALIQASASGFLSVTDTVDITDDETPELTVEITGPQSIPEPTTVPGTGITEMITNGDFETGDFTGWTVTNSGSGAWNINNGTFDPQGPSGPLSPISGSFDAVTDQGGPGLHLLTEVFVVPSNVTNAVLSWSDRIRNTAAAFSDPNQEWRVHILDGSGGLIQEVFSTNPGDPLMQVGPNVRLFDLTSLLQSLGGQQIQVSFQEEDNLGFFNVTLDDVSFSVTTDTGSGGVSSVPLEDHAAIVTPVNIVLDSVDDGTALVSIGFDFSFFGMNYTDLFVSSNGLITFGVGNNAFTNTDLTNFPPQAVIAPLWDDWRTDIDSNDAVYAAVIPDPAHSGFSQLVIRWETIPHFGEPVTAQAPVTFEAVLSEFDDSIQFNYIDLDTGNPSFDDGASATVGIKDAGNQGLDRLLISFNDLNALVGTGKAVRIAAPTVISTTTARVTRNTPTDTDLVVDLTSLDLSEATVPATVTIFAGQTSASFVITPVDDPILDGDQNVTIVASASGFASDSADIIVEDDPADPPLSTGLSDPILNFAGQSNSFVSPPDTVGDVGIDHYVQAINGPSGAIIEIYNKSDGSIAVPQFDLDTLAAGATGGSAYSGAGDPIVLYDHLADRWILMEFEPPGGSNQIHIFISNTGVPTGNGADWTQYRFAAPNFPDYPKMTLWPDAYFIGTNEVDNPVYALDRVQMLAGAGGDITANVIRMTTPDRPFWQRDHIMPADLDGPMPPAAGEPGIFVRQVDDEYTTPGLGDPLNDFLEVWEFSPDFVTPANTTYTQVANIPIEDFDYIVGSEFGRGDIEQPGTFNELDALPHYIMWRLQYRNFGTQETLVANFTHDVGEDGTPDDDFGTAREQAGIRWFELRKVGGGLWTLHQEGDIAPDSNHRWMGSAAMDGAGNIAVGYSVSSSTVSPGIRYTGRLANDPLGTMQAEKTLINGSGAQLVSNRWGDYSALNVDPVDDSTFWYTTEYVDGTGDWTTRIGTFSIETAQNVGLNFTGSTFNDSGFIPPDTMGSVGPNHIVELINGRYAVYDKASGAPVQSSSLDQFWVDAGVIPVSFSFDPRIVYDHDSQRWFAVAVDNAVAANNFLVAVSNSSDPTAGWVGFQIDSDSDDSHWADFETLGVDADGIYLSANMFPLTGAGVPSNVLSIPKADLIGPTPTVANLTLIEDVSTIGFAVQPALDFGPSDGRAVMLAANPGGGTSILRTDIQGSTGPGATLSSTISIPVPFYAPPPLADQPGPKADLDTGGARFSSNVIEQGDSLWVAHTIDDAATGNAAIRWYEIDEVSNSVLQSGTIADADLDFYFPSIAANASGDIVIGFSGSSETQFVSSYAVRGDTVGGVTTFESPILLQAGVADYERLDGIGRNRWGDYSATVLDPADPDTFWTFQEFVSATDIWAIQITELQVGAAAGEKQLIVSITDPSISEFSGTSTATVTRTGDTSGDLVVTLSSSDFSEASVPPTVTILDGQASATFDVNSVNDSIADGTQTAFITASATGYDSISDFVDVTDNEVAGLTVFISPGSISEADGPGAATGTVIRNTPTDEDQIVFLTSSDASEAQVPISVIIPAGENFATFPIDAVNEIASDGLRNVNIFATASGFFHGSDNLFVIPDAASSARQINRLGDGNLDREQGQLLIQGNTISNVSGAAINIGPSPREAGSNVSHPGAAINLPTLNPQRLAPGAVISNNVIHNFGQAGISFRGDPNTGNVSNAVVPFGKIYNNTIYGGTSPTGIGVQVANNASPTLLNNIVANTATAVQIDGSSSSTVVGTTLFQGNSSIGTIGSNFIVLGSGDPLFVDPAIGNFYLVDDSLAIDSSLTRLADRPAIVNVKTPLFIPPSDIFAPLRDVRGQLRVDDPSQAPPPGLGFQVFADRGAIERADFVGPIVRLIDPEDNDFAGLDVDLDLTEVFLVAPVNQGVFELQFIDQIGIGIDDASVVSSEFELRRSGTLLTEGTDYFFSYNANNDTVRFISPEGAFPNDIYTIDINNDADAIPGSGVRDLAGNSVRPNQTTGETRFTIVLGPEISVNDVAVDEGNSGITTFTFTVSLSAPSTGVVTVDVETADDTATVADGDYLPLSTTTITFNPGQLTRTFSVDVFGDIDKEPDETFFVNLTNPSPTAIIGDAQGVGTIVNDDLPSFSVSDVSMDEGDTPDTTDFEFFVSASELPLPGQPVSVEVFTSDGTATVADNDYIPILPGTPVVVTFTDAGPVPSAFYMIIDSLTIAVPVTVIGDFFIEPDEMFFVNLANPTGVSRIVDAQGVGTILNDEPMFSVDDVEITEGDAGSSFATFTVSASKASTLPMSVDVTTSNGTAFVSDNDYVPLLTGSTTLVFPAGLPGDPPPTQTFTVEIVGDLTQEEDETFFVNLSNPVEATIADGQGIGTIIDDDRPIVSISDAVPIDPEGDVGFTNAVFTVSLSKPGDFVVTVDVSTADDTATGGVDYQPVGPLTLTFPVGGPLTQTVLVPVFGDTVDEDDESFFVNLSNLSGAILGDDQGVAAIINDDDPEISINDVVIDPEGNSGTQTATFTITFSNNTNVPVTYDVFTSNGSATAGSDYVAIPLTTFTFNPGDPLTRTVDVTVNGDTMDEINETFFVNIVNAPGATIVDGQGQGTIVNDDDPTISISDAAPVLEGDSGTVNAVFTVSLSGISIQPVTVNVQTANGTATLAGNDYVQLPIPTTVTFSPGQLSKTVSVAIRGDLLVETDETFFVNLSGPTNATIFDGQGQGTIINDDFPTISVSDATPVVEGDSGQRNAVFLVSLSVPTFEIITVQVATADGTGANPATVADNDYQAVSTTLTFSPGGPSTQPVNVPINGDLTLEDDENFFLNLSNPTFSSIADGQGIGTILNDDLPLLSISDAPPVIEGNFIGTTDAVFTVTLSQAYTEPVTVEVVTLDGTARVEDGNYDYVPDRKFLAFLPGGPLTQEVRIAINGDPFDEVDEIFFANLENVSNALIIDGQGVGTILNDDNPRISINDAPAILEGNSGTKNAVFTVSLSNVTNEVVTVEVSTADDSAELSDNDYVPLTTTLTFTPGGPTTQTVNVAVRGDEDDEFNETFFVNLSNPTNSSLGDFSGVGTIVNDDNPTISVSDALAVVEGNSGQRNAVFTVSLSRPTNEVVTVVVNTFDLTATVADNDYLPVGPVTLTFNPGPLVPQVVLVPVVGDLKEENDELFLVNLSNPTNATIGDGQGLGTIVDDDSPLVAEDGQGAGGVAALSDAELSSVVNEAVGRWLATGLSQPEITTLSQLTFQVVDLDEGMLGLTTLDIVSIDVDAAGWGWFVDTTPADDLEFTTFVGGTEFTAGAGSPATGQMDLLTAVMHELGHVLNYNHNNDPQALMSDTLPTGTRRSTTSIHSISNSGVDITVPDLQMGRNQLLTLGFENVSQSGAALSYSANVVAGDPVATLAYELDQQYNFSLPAGAVQNNYWHNFRGAGEKYLSGYFIKGNGDLHRWAGSIAASPLIATLDVRYHENPSLLVDVQAPETGDAAYDLDQQYNFTLPAGAVQNNYWFNARGAQEKYLSGFFIKPGGGIYKWGGSIAGSTLVGTVDARYYDNPSLLVNVPTPASPDVSISVVGSNVVIAPAVDYSGQFQVTVTASDGTSTGSDTFSVAIVNNAPQLAAIDDQTVTQDGTLEVDLAVSDADGDDLDISVSAGGTDAVAQLAYDLDQQYNFSLPAGAVQNNYWHNHRGAGEKYLSGFFIKENGDLHLWAGSIAASPLIATLDSRYHQDPSLLVDAAAPQSSQSADPAYQLDQQYNFSLPAGAVQNNYWLNARGAQEKYLAGFFILPNGNVYKWGGSIAGSKLIGTVDTRYYDNPSLLVDVPPPAAANHDVSIEGSKLVIAPAAGFVGQFEVTVTVSDGEESDSVTFMVTVKESTQPDADLDTVFAGLDVMEL